MLGGVLCSLTFFFPSHPAAVEHSFEFWVTRPQSHYALQLLLILLFIVFHVPSVYLPPHVYVPHVQKTHDLVGQIFECFWNLFSSTTKKRSSYWDVALKAVSHTMHIFFKETKHITDPPLPHPQQVQIYKYDWKHLPVGATEVFHLGNFHDYSNCDSSEKCCRQYETLVPRWGGLISGMRPCGWHGTAEAVIPNWSSAIFHPTPFAFLT